MFSCKNLARHSRLHISYLWLTFLAKTFSSLPTLPVLVQYIVYYSPIWLSLLICKMVSTLWGTYLVLIFFLGVIRSKWVYSSIPASATRFRIKLIFFTQKNNSYFYWKCAKPWKNRRKTYILGREKSSWWKPDRLAGRSPASNQNTNGEYLLSDGFVLVIGLL